MRFEQKFSLVCRGVQIQSSYLPGYINGDFLSYVYIREMRCAANSLDFKHFNYSDF